MKTETIKHIQTILKVDADGELGPITRTAFANKLISIAKKDIGIYETSQNHGVGIEKYWTATSYTDGYINREPYCAAAVSYWISQSNVFPSDLRPLTAAAFGFEQWGKKVGMNVIKDPSNVKKGDLVIFDFSHIGIATSDSDKNGYFKTIEANTSSGEKGSQRDGGGVYARTRHISTLRSVVRL